MNEFFLFTDGSFDPKSKFGVGGYLLCESLEDSHAKDRIKTKFFANTTCSRLELQALLWAIEEESLKFKDKKIMIYTDSQTIVNLPSRKERISNTHLNLTNKKNLNNGDLYQEFFLKINLFNMEICWVKGHKKLAEKDKVDIHFSILDRTLRSLLRKVTKMDVIGGIERKN